MKRKKVVEKVTKADAKQAPGVSKEELRQMLDQEMQKQIQACRKELDEANKVILDKYQCDLEVRVTVTARGNIPNLAVIPRVR